MLQLRKSNSAKGFTFIEMLAVVTIIGICGALFKVMFSYKKERINANIARQELSLLNCALEMFRLEKGFYPVCNSKSNDENAKNLYKNLSAEIRNIAAHHKWKIVDGKILDPWQRPYVYRCESVDAVAYTLFSDGPNSGAIDDMSSR